MAGLFPSIGNSQNVDINGVPQRFAVLSVYNGGTLTLANCFQDIGLAIGAQNPMTADINSRLPLFYVADGVYRVRLVDEDGVLIYDYPQVASIGASSSGGGGTAVDPTTVFSTGDEFWKKVGGARTGWVRQNARTIGSATSGASERANTDCNALFLYLWANYTDAKCPVVSGRGVSAAADWAANKQITLPDMRGKGPHGLDGMGAARANVIADTDVTSSGDTGDTDAASGGAATRVIVQANLPAVDLAVTIPAGQGSHKHDVKYDTRLVTSPGGQPVTVLAAGATDPNTDVDGAAAKTLPAMSGAAASGGTGTALETMNPFALGTWYIKL